MTDSLTHWLSEKVESVSWGEVIENYRTWANARNKAAFARVRLDIPHPGKPIPHARVSILQDSGHWTERKSPISWRAGRPRREPFFACVARTKLRYKGWTSSPIARIGFLRVGIGGAIFLTPNGDKTEISGPPFDRPPPYIETFLTPGPGGRFVMSSRTHPDRERWDSWEAAIHEISASLRAAADARGTVADLHQHANRSRAACSMCERHPAEDVGSDAVWRLVRGKLICATCTARNL